MSNFILILASLSFLMDKFHGFVLFFVVESKGTIIPKAIEIEKSANRNGYPHFFWVWQSIS